MWTFLLQIISNREYFLQFYHLLPHLAWAFHHLVTLHHCVWHWRFWLLEKGKKDDLSVTLKCWLVINSNFSVSLHNLGNEQLHIICGYLLLWLSLNGTVSNFFYLLIIEKYLNWKKCNISSQSQQMFYSDIYAAWKW